MGQHTSLHGRSKYSSSVVSAGTASVTLKIEDQAAKIRDEKEIKEGLDAKAPTLLPQLVVAARNAVDIALLVLRNEEWRSLPKVKEKLGICFSAAGGLSNTQRLIAIGVYQRTKDGLVGPLTIKLANLSSEHADVHGGVRWYDAASTARPHLVQHTTSKGTKFFSNIKIDGRYFIDNSTGSRRAILMKTLIHEATHRFAGTEDHRYLAADGMSFQDGDATTQPIDTNACLENADSYAWFAYWMEKFKRAGDFGA
jgi:hypothetical protein